MMIPFSGNTKTLIVGTYTSPGESDGIHVFDFDCHSGCLKLKSKISGVENPSYLAVSPNGKFIHSVNEDNKGSLSAFSFNADSGELVFLNRVSSNGDSPCYISTDKNNKYVFAGNYGSGSLLAVSLNEDGSFSDSIQMVQHEGSSIDASRQEGPHVHCTIVAPDNKYLLSADLGTDKVYVYQFDASDTSRPLSPAEPAFATVKAGSGPRHIAFHPNSKFVYLIQEMGGNITVFDYKNGKLAEKQTCTILLPGFQGEISAADIHVSPDGKFLYGSNRGDANELVIYAIDKNGRLDYVGRQKTMGKDPRNFVIDPSGNFILVANQNSNEIVVFRRDHKTGLLFPLDQKTKVEKPVCLKFAGTDSKAMNKF